MSDEELAAFGMSAKDYDDLLEVTVWPDNWSAVRVFQMLSTQWRSGMSGPTGIDYATLPAVMQMAGIRKKERSDLFDCIRIMEGAALTVIHEKD